MLAHIVVKKSFVNNLYILVVSPNKFLLASILVFSNLVRFFRTLIAASETSRAF